MSADYRNYMPENSTRTREEIEWSIHYSYETNAVGKPRVLLVGDSICNGYQDFVRRRLEDECCVSFWASSKCVTDKFYLRELDFYLDYAKYDVISFNNGLHSLGMNLDEWEIAYRDAAKFILTKVPESKLYLTLSTPLCDPKLTEISAKLNATVKRIADELNLPTIDLFTPMDGLERDKHWCDCFHFNDSAKEIQADIIASAVRAVIR